MLRQITDAEPTPPRKLNAAIPDELETILLKSIAKDAADRYSSAGALADDLGRFLRNDPIHARRPSLLARTGKWVRRHPIALIGALSSLACLLIVVSIAFFLVAGEKEQTKTSLHEKTAALQKSEASLAFAREAVDSMYVELAGSWLANTSTQSAVQREFLERAARFYDELASQTEHDPAQLSTTATALARIGEIHSYLHQPQLAADALEKSIRLSQQAANDAYVPASEQIELAGRYRLLHDLFLQLGRNNRAADTLAEGWEYVQAIPADFGTDIIRDTEIAAWSAYRASHAIREDRPQQAEEFARQGKRLSADVRRRQGDDSNVEPIILMNRCALAAALAAQGRLAEADNECRAALKACRQIRVSDMLDYRPLQELEIRLLDQLADIETAENNHQNAADHLREILALRRKQFEQSRSPSDVVSSMFRTVLGGKENWKGNYDPEAFCGYAETQVKLPSC